MTPAAERPSTLLAGIIIGTAQFLRIPFVFPRYAGLTDSIVLWNRRNDRILVPPAIYIRCTNSHVFLFLAFFFVFYALCIFRSFFGDNPGAQPAAASSRRYQARICHSTSSIMMPCPGVPRSLSAFRYSFRPASDLSPLYLLFLLYILFPSFCQFLVHALIRKTDRGH